MKFRQTGITDHIDFVFNGFRIGDKVRMKPFRNKDGTIKQTVHQEDTVYTIIKYFTLSKQVQLLSPNDSKAHIIMNLQSIEKVKE